MLNSEMSTVMVKLVREMPLGRTTGWRAFANTFDYAFKTLEAGHFRCSQTFDLKTFELNILSKKLSERPSTVFVKFFKWERDRERERTQERLQDKIASYKILKEISKVSMETYCSMCHSKSFKKYENHHKFSIKRKCGMLRRVIKFV